MVEGCEHVLGVDGGASGTRCVIANASGELLARGTGGPSNPITVGVEAAADAITEAVNEAVESCGVWRFGVACMGIAGAMRPPVLGALRSRLATLDVMKLEMISDAVIALAGATGCRHGVVVIAGTGSIAYGENEGGETARAGGWGWRLGDEGSGNYIGSRALIAAVRSHDGRDPPTVLAEKVRTALGLTDMSEMIDRVYLGGMGVEDVSALAVLVGEAAEEGDGEAIRILEDAGAELGAAALTVARKLGLSGGFIVAPTGGAFNLGLLKASFDKAVKQGAAQCCIISPRFEPAVGAALLALKELGVDVCEGLLERVEASYNALRGDA
ncbi:MAG: ATPase [Candidatus Bathyarchaeota archaeon]|nr:ATPase [Candidatus Bathyarchaeota archaeon]MDH5792727.1 ATPase [Candidatus Bathyarchaeota archaeon]